MDKVTDDYLHRLYKFLNQTTLIFPRGAEPIAPYAHPYFDMVLCKVTVRKDIERRREEFLGLVREYPDARQLEGGPSYITAGATLGDQGMAFRFFAVGKLLGLWDVITPYSFGLDPTDKVDALAAEEAAGRGFVMCSGWREGDKGVIK